MKQRNYGDSMNNRDCIMSDQVLSCNDTAIEPISSPEASSDVSPAIDTAADAADTDQVCEEHVGPELPSRPQEVPETFWDVSTGAVRTAALLKSYLQLEKKLGTMVPLPTDDDPTSQEKLLRALGRPESPDGYNITSPHELLSVDPEINNKLHEAGLTSEQAQLVYDLAAEHVLPMIERVSSDANQEQELAKLTSHFGGEQSWQALAPQIKSWGQANLTDDIYEALGSSFDGVVAIHHMMQSREPNIISEATVSTTDLDEGALTQLMRDPKYWRDRDPAYVARVTEGYKRLYG